MKTIIITGANGNLGAVTVKKFLENDYRVIAVARSGSKLGFAKDNKNFELHQIDLADENAALLFIKEAISLYGSIEGALFLAGGFAMSSIADTTGTDLKKMFALNFETAYHISRILFQHMLQNGYGRLVFIGSKPVFQPEHAKRSVAYTLSKSLLFNFANILNAEAKGKNVTASVVVPSTIDTAPNRQSMPEADWSKWVKPEQIAGILEFICSDKGLSLREPLYKVYNDA
ncbi:SDR family NAD(P)-dependent oxidoreductase [Agriterribacter sp.]|uniref:SDR family NAD(P)-dependent oxidoreductase n=1 Tax=Agriterribacter sp. TaxID=2821509 RepID=UPI002CAB38C2|nr:SDR family NAD(P)-dependent oxidoreductase [Agriterribacter sp.]HRO47598.1 SDR family NAD(P)-dependent oxidoreductase [Agriterribacter sp.]HRQ18693.1 SDR family NAD(P)-dependent oxidoreductase [Agriterribacter sp.]